MGMCGGGGGASSKLKKLASKLIVLPCAAFSSSSSPAIPPSILGSSEMMSPPKQGDNCTSEIAEEGESTANISSRVNAGKQNLCTICLEPLKNCDKTASPSHAVFTAQCSHSFHLSCISSNIRHGSITCPICRAHWTCLPRTLHPPCWLSRNQDDPIIRILDDSITTFRVHRRSFLRSAHYDDDDPVEPESRSPRNPRLCFSLVPSDVSQTPPSSSSCSCAQCSSVHLAEPISYHSPGPDSHRWLTDPLSPWYKRNKAMYLSVRLAPQQAIDLVLVASPNGPHLRLLKQSMALVVFSLRPVDRLAIVSYSSSAARIFPLRRMTSYGKRAALQVIDRLFYTGHADPIEGIKKGVKILNDRAHTNPQSCILHLSDNRTSFRSHCSFTDMDTERPVAVHQFHVASNGSILHELEGFLSQMLGGGIRDIELRIGDQTDGRIVRLGELSGDEERRVLLDPSESCANVYVSYSYIEGGFEIEERIRTGEVVVTKGERMGIDDSAEASTVNGARTSCVDSWDYYHDPYMARRWARRLHAKHRP